MIDNKNVGDFKFIILEEVISKERKLSNWDNLIMSFKIFIKKINVSPEKWFGIDTSIVEVEKVPITIGRIKKIKLKETVYRFV